MGLAWAYAAPLMIEAAVENRVFDVLNGRPQTIQEVAQETGASERGLRALMNALVGIELLAKEPGGRYRLTPESEAFLVSAKPAYHGAFFQLMSKRIIP